MHEGSSFSPSWPTVLALVIAIAVRVTRHFVVILKCISLIETLHFYCQGPEVDYDTGDHVFMVLQVGPLMRESHFGTRSPGPLFFVTLPGSRLWKEAAREGKPWLVVDLSVELKRKRSTESFAGAPEIQLWGTEARCVVLWSSNTSDAGPGQ